jgi:hypothetical protein
MRVYTQRERDEVHDMQHIEQTEFTVNGQRFYQIRCECGFEAAAVATRTYGESALYRLAERHLRACH